MDNSTEPKLTVGGAIGSRPSDPARLCCALTTNITRPFAWSARHTGRRRGPPTANCAHSAQ
jgi:hypothetical protein